MTDPAKLANEIGDSDCAEFPFMLLERHRRLVAAALRLAEAAGNFEDESIGVRSYFVANNWTDTVAAYDAMVEAASAYRAAKEEA